MSKVHTFTTPVGRMVGGGSLYIGKTENFDGKPLTFADGSARQEYTFGVAFPKTPGVASWWLEEWLKPVMQCGFDNFSNGEAQRPDFAWKITDGDSTMPGKPRQGKPGVRPCDKEGWPGCWVIWFGGATAPKIWNADATQLLLQPDAVKPGFYVQVQASCKGNTGATPGLYMNHHHVSLQGYGPEIVSGPDVKTAGFGQAALPAGASTVPVGAMAPNVPGAPAAPQMMPAPSVPSSLSVPHTASVPALPVSVQSADLVLTPKAMAEGVTLAALRTNPQWTDEMIVAHGYGTRVAAAPAPAPAMPAPNVPGLPAMAGSVPAMPGPVPTAAAPAIVTPNPAFLQVPAVPAVAAAPVMQPTQKLLASGYTLAQFLGDPQWTEATLRAHGYIV